MTHINIIDVIVLILAGATLLTSAAIYHLVNENQTDKIENRFNTMESLNFALGFSAWASIGIAYIVPSMNLGITAICYILVVLILEAIFVIRDWKHFD